MSRPGGRVTGGPLDVELGLEPPARTSSMTATIRRSDGCGRSARSSSSPGAARRGAAASPSAPRGRSSRSARSPTRPRRRRSARAAPRRLRLHDHDAHVVGDQVVQVARDARALGGDAPPRRGPRGSRRAPAPGARGAVPPRRASRISRPPAAPRPSGIRRMKHDRAPRRLVGSSMTNRQREQHDHEAAASARTSGGRCWPPRTRGAGRTGSAVSAVLRRRARCRAATATISAQREPEDRGRRAPPGERDARPPAIDGDARSPTRGGDRARAGGQAGQRARGDEHAADGEHAGRCPRRARASGSISDGHELTVTQPPAAAHRLRGGSPVIRGDDAGSPAEQRGFRPGGRRRERRRQASIAASSTNRFPGGTTTC